MKQKQQQHSGDERIMKMREDGWNFREMEVETISEEGKEPVVRMSVSSETPVLTYIRMGDNYMMAYEILDHSESSIDRSRCKDGLVIQDTHWGDQVGLIRYPVIVNKKFGGDVEFCTGERAKDIGTDAKKGLRKNSSVGYKADPQKYVLEGEKDGYPLVRSKRWTPYEASFVNVPADTSVGVGRSLTETQTAVKTVEKTERNMDPKEMAKLFERAAQFGIAADKVSALVADGKGRAELDAMIVEKQAADIAAQRAEVQALKDQKPPAGGERATVVTTTPKTDVPAVEMRKFSVMNVIRYLGGSKVDIGREREISEQMAKERGKPASGIIIPHAVLAERVLTVSGTSSASVATDVMGNEFIDLVRTTSILGELGVRFMPGMVGNVAYPKMTAGATGYWVAENAAITGSTPTLGQVTGTPHTCGALVDISRLLLAQSTPSAELFTRNEIIERIARTIQVAVFAGTGADGQPSAITTATGINNPSVTQGTPTYAELLAFIGDIYADNSAANNMKWAMTGEVWAKLGATATNGAGSALALNPATKTLAGFGYVNPCEDLPANSLWFGDWSTVMIPIWGNGVDMIVDTNTLSSSGGLRLVGLQDVDVCVRNGKALAYNTAVTS